MHFCGLVSMPQANLSDKNKVISKSRVIKKFCVH